MALAGRKADEVYARLHVRRKGDILSERFHDTLSTALRRELLQLIGRKHDIIVQFFPDPADFCQPFSQRERDQGLDFETHSEMEHFVNYEMRELRFWGDEVVDLFDDYLTGIDQGVTRIFDNSETRLVQSFVHHPVTNKRQRELADTIEKNLSIDCSQLSPNKWVDIGASSAAIIPVDVLKAPFSFSDVKTIPGIIAGGVSPGPNAPEWRSLSLGQLLIRRAVVGGRTTGLRMRVQFHFVVHDSIDFCPGAMGGFFAKYITIKLSRLEKSGLAYPVPFEVRYDGPVLEVELGPAAKAACP